MYFSKYENINRYCSLLLGIHPFLGCSLNQYKHERILSSAIVRIKRACQSPSGMNSSPGPWPGPDGYPRVLDYSIFKSLLVPYSKNFTTRSSSRVVTISSFCPIIQIFGMGRHHSFLDNGRHVSNDVVA